MFCEYLQAKPAAKRPAGEAKATAAKKTATSAKPADKKNVAKKPAAKKPAASKTVRWIFINRNFLISFYPKTENFPLEVKCFIILIQCSSIVG